MSNRPFTLIASLIFALMAAVHVIRLVTGFQVIAGSHAIPMWVSWVGILVPALLAWGLYRESRR